MTRMMEAERSGLRFANGAAGIEFTPLSHLLAALAVELRGRRILQIGTRGCFGIGDLLEAYRPARLAAYEFGEARPAAAAWRGPRSAVALPSPQPIPEDDASFDAAFAYGVLDLPQHWSELLREIARVLAPRGVLVVQTPADGARGERLAQLASALQQTGLTLALHQRQPGLADILIARRG